MKLIQLTAITTVLSVVLAGCNSPPVLMPSPGRTDPVPAPMNDPQISVLSPELREWLGFQSAIVVSDGVRPMNVEIPMRNLTNRQYLIEYRIIFFDDTGQEVTPVMSWEFVSMEPKQTVRLKRRALSTTAETYKLEVKWSR